MTDFRALAKNPTLCENGIMDAKAKADILHGVVRKFGGGGGDITSEEWGRSSPPRTTAIAPGRKSARGFPISRLPDQHGKTRTLKDLSGPNGLLLVFSRSADW